MANSKKINSKKTVKEFCGTMFEVFANPEGWIKARPTQDPEKAVDIVTPVSKKVCAYCPTDKCLNNIVGERMVFPDNFKDSAEFEMTRIKYFDIAKCKNEKGKVFFIIIRDTLPRLIETGRCIWCKSAYAERLPNVNKLRERLSSAERIKKYYWVVWRWGESEKVSADKAGVYGQLEGMMVDEVNTFLYKNPWKCKHCYRVFGYDGRDEEGQALFAKLAEQVRMKDLKESFMRFKILEKDVVFKHAKCPFCSTQYNYGAYELESLVQLILDPTGFYIAKRRCSNCKSLYFVVSDVYDMYKSDKKNY
jgi:hypothetical protein